MSDQESEYELVMPFVTVTSKGGLHDDQAYVAGWQCGVLDEALTQAAHIGATLTRTFLTENLPQVDLIAMKHGFSHEVLDGTEVDQVEGWTTVRFERVA